MVTRAVGSKCRTCGDHYERERLINAVFVLRVSLFIICRVRIDL